MPEPLAATVNTGSRTRWKRDVSFSTQSRSGTPKEGSIRPFVDLLDPVGVEQRRCRGTISQRKLLAKGPDLPQASVGCAEPFARNAAVSRVSMLCRSAMHRIRDGLHVRHYAEVEHAVEEANAAPELSVRNPAVGPGMVRLQMPSARKALQAPSRSVLARWSMWPE
jgi:hypothetical protein